MAEPTSPRSPLRLVGTPPPPLEEDPDAGMVEHPLMPAELLLRSVVRSIPLPPQPQIPAPIGLKLEYTPPNSQTLDEKTLLPECQQCHRPVRLPVLFPGRNHISCAECAILALNTRLRESSAPSQSPGTPNQKVAAVIECRDLKCTDSACGRVLVVDRRPQPQSMLPFTPESMPFEPLPRGYYRMIDHLSGLAKCKWCGLEGGSNRIVEHLHENECTQLTLVCQVCGNDYLACMGYWRHANSGHRRMLHIPEFKEADHDGWQPPSLEDVLPVCCICQEVCTTPTLFGCQTGHVGCTPCVIQYNTALGVNNPPKVCPLCKQQQFKSTRIRIMNHRLKLPMRRVAPALLMMHERLLEMAGTKDIGKCPYCLQSFSVAEAVWHIPRCPRLVVGCGRPGCTSEVSVIMGAGFHNGLECAPPSQVAPSFRAEAARLKEYVIKNYGKSPQTEEMKLIGFLISALSYWVSRAEFSGFAAFR